MAPAPPRRMLFRSRAQLQPDAALTGSDFGYVIWYTIFGVSPDISRQGENEKNDIGMEGSRRRRRIVDVRQHRDGAGGAEDRRNRQPLGRRDRMGPRAAA